jgi:hypothetical protein
MYGNFGIFWSISSSLSQNWETAEHLQCSFRNLVPSTHRNRNLAAIDMLISIIWLELKKGWSLPDARCGPNYVGLDLVLNQIKLVAKTSSSSPQLPTMQCSKTRSSLHSPHLYLNSQALRWLVDGLNNTPTRERFQMRAFNKWMLPGIVAFHTPTIKQVAFWRCHHHGSEVVVGWNLITCCNAWSYM